jgi:voltage-gated potassium channel
MIGKYFRYGVYLLREFRWPIGVLTALILGGGALLSATLPIPYAKACHVVFMLCLAEPTIDFPELWYDEILFFVVPVIGLGAIADSFVRLGYLIFSSKRKLQEWWIMEASVLRNHIVLVGLGKSGLRIARELREVRETFVAIEKDPEGEFVSELQEQDVPVIFGDARHRKVLEKANVEHARAIILATDDDLANFDAALTAREVKPDIKVVMRLFDDTLARKVTKAFDLKAISVSQVAAPAFVAAATDRNVFHAFELDGRLIHVADIKAKGIAGRRIADIQHAYDVSVVMHKSPRMTDYAPHHDRPIEPGDVLVVMAELDRIHKVEEANR